MDKQIIIKKVFKFLLPVFLILISVIVILLFLIGGLSGLKEMLPVFLYIIPILLFVFLIFGFIGYFGYKKRSDKNFQKKILIVQNPLIMALLSVFGISLDTSNPKDFAFYYNFLFGIYLIVLGFISFFTSGDYRIGLIPFVFGLVVIVVAILKRK